MLTLNTRLASFLAHPVHSLFPPNFEKIHPPLYILPLEWKKIHPKHFVAEDFFRRAQLSLRRLVIFSDTQRERISCI